MISDVKFFAEFLMNYFPYETTLRIKDTITFVSGIIIGMIVMALFICHLVVSANIQWREFDLNDDVVAVRFTKDGFTSTYVDPPKNFLGGFNVILALFILRFDHKDTISLKDLRKTKIIIFIIVVLCLFLVFIGVSFILSPYLPNR